MVAVSYSADGVSSSRYQPSLLSRPGVVTGAAPLPVTPSRPRRYPPSARCGAGAGSPVAATETVSALMWQLPSSGQPRVTSFSPLASLTGTEAVCQSSQLSVAGNSSVACASPAVTEAVRVLCCPSPPVPLA